MRGLSIEFMDFGGLGEHPLIRLAAPSPRWGEGDGGDLRSYAIPLPLAGRWSPFGKLRRPDEGLR
ncbi:hypothetical protein A9Z06_28045 [Rhizobium sp. YK2]|nr:hypothetical protein A9Z06_28045 [Rhizobium sp. YK2]